MSSPCRPGSSTSGARRPPRTSRRTRRCSRSAGASISRGSGRRGCANWGRPACRWPHMQSSASKRRDSRSRLRDRQRLRSLRSVSDGTRARSSRTHASRASIRATRSVATTKDWTTSCSWRSPSAARLRRSTVSPPCSPRRPDEGRTVKLIYEKSQSGRRASALPRYENLPSPTELPERLRRTDPPRLPEVPEFELVRHFTELSTRNFGVDTGFYPLGSCTMKYNPRINERLAALPGFARLHPLQEEAGAQGALELMWRLQQILADVPGLAAVSLQPAAGSQGELTGLMLVRAYFAARGEAEQRRKVVIPDTAHGTNPASVTMAGYELTHVQTDARGNIDVDDLRGKVDEHTAALMLTNPSTLGLFDENIEEIERIFHGAGALMYYDGANLNAVCGISRPGDMGFDIVHINLHKTFSQPHGGGGPGGGPVAVRDILEPFLPVPAVVRRKDGGFGLDHDRPQTIGKVRGFTGPFGVFVRSYAYMRMWGPRLREMSEVAVLNANYVLARLKDTYDLPFERLCMHEFVLPARTMKREHGCTAPDVAKPLMDSGVTPPTTNLPPTRPEA